MDNGLHCGVLLKREYSLSFLSGPLMFIFWAEIMVNSSVDACQESYFLKCVCSVYAFKCPFANMLETFCK